MKCLIYHSISSNHLHRNRGERVSSSVSAHTCRRISLLVSTCIILPAWFPLLYRYQMENRLKDSTWLPPTSHVSRALVWFAYLTVDAQKPPAGDLIVPLKAESFRLHRQSKWDGRPKLPLALSLRFFFFKWGHWRVSTYTGEVLACFSEDSAKVFSHFLYYLLYATITQ